MEGGGSFCICCNETLHFNIMLLAQQDRSCMFNSFNSQPPLPGLITTEGHSHADMHRRTLYRPKVPGKTSRACPADQLCSENQTCFFHWGINVYLLSNYHKTPTRFTLPLRSARPSCAPGGISSLQDVHQDRMHKEFHCPFYKIYWRQ